MISLLENGKQICCGLLFILFSCSAKKDNANTEVIQAAALKADFDILRTTLEEAHPGLYWYSKKAVMNNFFDSVKGRIDHDMSPAAFFKIILPVIANIRCLHTNLRLPTNTNRSANPFTHLLPFDFFCINNHLYISKDLNGTGHEGEEIRSINEVGTNELIGTLLASLPADGFNQSYKLQLLSKGAFREGYALFFGQPSSFTMQTTKRNTNQLTSFTATAISPKNLLPPAPTPPPFQLDFRGGTALLRINSFAINAHAFADSVSAIFKKIQQMGALHLVIDLRQNGGGTNNNVSQLYSFIATAPFIHLKKAEMRALPLTFTQFITGLQTVSKPERSLKNKRVYVVNDRYAGTSVRNPAQKYRFDGDVIVLTSGNTASAASEFVAIARFLKRVKTVGEETGGCYYRATGGNYLKLKLPSSGLEVRIPTISIVMAVDEDFKQQPAGRGTFPDYSVTPTITDIIEGRDVQLEKALEIFNN